MKIVSIFADHLYAVHYHGEKNHELKRLIDLWNDAQYLYEFVKNNSLDIPRKYTIPQIINKIIQDASHIDNILHHIEQNPGTKLNSFFFPLYDEETKVVSLGLRKGKRFFLRIYAIKIDEDCFLITGGAIKFHHLMKDKPHTQKELSKLHRCKEFLKENGVNDRDSFFEFINE